MGGQPPSRTQLSGLKFLVAVSQYLYRGSAMPLTAWLIKARGPRPLSTAIHPARNLTYSSK